MTVKIARLQITVLDDRWNQNIPLVDFCVNNLNASASNWSSDMKVSCPFKENHALDLTIDPL